MKPIQETEEEDYDDIEAALKISRSQSLQQVPSMVRKSSESDPEKQTELRGLHDRYKKWKLWTEAKHNNHHENLKRPLCSPLTQVVSFVTNMRVQNVEAIRESCQQQE